MPIIKSAIKRVRQTETRTRRNTITKDRYKALVKEYKILISEGKTKEAGELFPKVQKAIDMAAKKNLLHKNNAAHKKSALAKMMPRTESKPAAKKAPAKKAE